jgi:hypothetical protein
MNTDKETLRVCVDCRWSLPPKHAMSSDDFMLCGHPNGLRDRVTGSPVYCSSNRYSKGEFFSWDGYDKSRCNEPGFFFEPKASDTISK